MTKGETYNYARSSIKDFLDEYPKVKLIHGYDISCRFQRHLVRMFICMCRLIFLY